MRLKCLTQGCDVVPLVSLEPGISLSQVIHSTNEPLKEVTFYQIFKYKVHYSVFSDAIAFNITINKLVAS